MRSLSNVIKHWGAKERPVDFIIDSNPKADAYFSHLQRQMEEADAREVLMKSDSETGSEEFKEFSSESYPRHFDYGRMEREARERADRIIVEANTTGEMIINKAFEDARLQEEEIKNTAMEEGYKEGYEKAMAEIREQKAELEKERLRLQKEFDLEIKRLEPKFASLVIQYVEKITGILAVEYESIIYNIMTLAINNNEPSKNYIIHVSKEQYKYVKSKEDYIKEVAGERSRVEIVSDATLVVNECKIETDTCVIDTGLDTRLTTLINSLKLLAGH